MSNYTGNTQAFIEAEQYSSFIQTNMHDGLLPQAFWYNVSDFMKGETLHLKQIGTATLQEVEEDKPITYNPIDTDEVTLRITEYVGNGWNITDKLRQDGDQIERLLSEHAMENSRAIREYFETQFLKTCNEGQTDADANLYAGFAHRIASSETDNVIALKHFIDMRVAFDKAQVPMGGRIAIVDVVCQATLANYITLGSDVTDFGREIITQGFARDHQFIMNLYGWDVMTSNRLDKGDFSDGTTAVTGAVANVFMCVSDDNCKPIMGAWRQMPKVEGERNKDFQRDEYVTTARFGFGVKRGDSLGVLITSATNY